MKAKTKQVEIPDTIRKVFEEYGHAFKLEQAVATRSAPERHWYAILFQEEGDGELTAVAFQQNAAGEWEVDDDGIGPFDSVKQFSTEQLVNRWF